MKSIWKESPEKVTMLGKHGFMVVEEGDSAGKQGDSAGEQEARLETWWW